jgi:hypothetical protein
MGVFLALFRLRTFTLLFVLALGCGKPECTGTATTDLGASQGGCDQAWIHGEQMCPQNIWCGHIVSCMAMSDSPLGSCTCKEASSQTCCPIAIVEPEGGTIRTMLDDADGEAPGLQISITVDIDCWYMTWAQLFVHVCDQAPGEAVRWFEPHADFHIPALADLGTQTGCMSVCADIMVYDGTVLASDTIQVCVE